MRELLNNNVVKVFAALIIVVSAGVVAYVTLSSLHNAGEPTSIESKKTTSTPKSPKLVDNAHITTRTIATGESVKTLSLFVYFDTKQQGDCTLSLINQKNTYEYKSSTVNVKNAVGCLPWNVSANNIVSGSYDVEVTFKPDGGDKIIHKFTLTVQ